ncbi:uncharacterized protein IL334_000365 [Kwoniella shivajii]|uniref:ditrans,polycis-polyprenyl diphosphate synthase [(2E,6E)-farnesyldiphosphate specific] n=1 Tax=Kwoniella shivajii TaxID=564305 RepID=A0ABZ1CNZ0_9TREE|nr:hypothetical protein IL334_000365 [Kwoniella shivajii]
MVIILSHVLRILSYPAFVLLHLTFVLSSLVLRTYQALTSTPESDNDNSNVDQKARNVIPPKHLALILVPSQKYRKGEKVVLEQSILRAVEWSLEIGINELSIWDGKGLIQSCLPNLIKKLSSHSTSNSNLPISPPSTPPFGPTQDQHQPSNRNFPRGHGHIQEEEEEEEDEDDDRYPPSPSPRRRGKDDLIKAKKGRNVGNEMRSLLVYSKGRNNNNGLKIHFLPPSSSSEMISNLTKRYIEMNINIDDINVKNVNNDIRDYLQFTSDPDLLLIHHLSIQSTWNSMLPRKAPELWGYPFWSLRITEIYQYPQPLPLLPYLNPLLNTLRSSSLPFLRKLGYTISLPRKLDPHGLLDKVEWEGAMNAWSKNEQRLGK